MSRIDKNHWLRTQKIAHRGLHDENIPENSMTAFKVAQEKGYAIELDVHITTDGEIVVFHDDDLKRMTGKDGKISSSSYQDLKDLTLSGTTEKISLFSEVLKEISTPLLIEIKNETTSSGCLEESLRDMLLSHKSPFAVQSFSPYSVMWFEKYQPDFLRGQLSSFFSKDSLAFYKRFVLKRLLFNKKTKPDFVSYDQRNIPNKWLKKCEDMVKIGWTVTSKEREEELKPFVDNIIFENYLP